MFLLVIIVRRLISWEYKVRTPFKVFAILSNVCVLSSYCVCACVYLKIYCKSVCSREYVCVPAAEASGGGLVLREAKKFLIRYLKEVRTTPLALGRREVRVQRSK